MGLKYPILISDGNLKNFSCPFDGEISDSNFKCLISEIISLLVKLHLQKHKKKDLGE